MGIKTFNPYTPSRRAMTMLDNEEITKSTCYFIVLMELSSTSL